MTSAHRGTGWRQAHGDPTTLHYFRYAGFSKFRSYCGIAANARTPAEAKKRCLVCEERSRGLGPDAEAGEPACR